MALLLPRPPSLSSLLPRLHHSQPALSIITPQITPAAPIPSKLQSFSYKPPHPIPRLRTLIASSSFGNLDLEFDAEEVDELSADSPWEGAVVYRRDASASHVEYCTTLERLGLGRLSSGVSRSRAAAMGIRLPPRRAAKQGELGGEVTPVLVSVDVSRRKRRLKLDGIVRTVITLGCNRCGEPAAESVFSNFSLLLMEDPIEDPDDLIDMGVIYGEDRRKSSFSSRTDEEEDDEKEIDPDDRFYFPYGEKEIDISKPIRDLVHLEITINAVCDAGCKGLCLKCGTNLNKGRCGCSREEVQDRGVGPLKNLREQMQQR